MPVNPLGFNRIACDEEAFQFDKVQGCARRTTCRQGATEAETAKRAEG